MAFNAKTLSALSQITPPPTRTSADALLTNIAAFNSLNQKGKLAIRVYCVAKQLANEASNPLTNYDPDTASKVLALMQDAKTVIGNVPLGDLESAKVAVDWANSKVVYSALSTDVDTLRGQVATLANYTEEELERALIYLNLELGN